jgi:hypothetical protein
MMEEKGDVAFGIEQIRPFSSSSNSEDAFSIIAVVNPVFTLHRGASLPALLATFTSALALSPSFPRLFFVEKRGGVHDELHMAFWGYVHAAGDLLLLLLLLPLLLCDCSESVSLLQENASRWAVVCATT